MTHQLQAGDRGVLDGKPWEIVQHQSIRYFAWDGIQNWLDPLPPSWLATLIPDKPKPHFEPDGIYIGLYKNGPGGTSVWRGSSLSMHHEPAWVEKFVWFRLVTEPVEQVTE